LEGHHIGEAAGLGHRHLQRAGRRRVGVDLRIALIGEQQKIVAARHRDGAHEITARRHRAFRI
jgi:hypothetical protein